MGITNINGIAITASLATTATTASKITVIGDGGTSAPVPILFVQNSGSVDARINSNLTYGILSNRLFVPNITASGEIIAVSFTGSLLGTSSVTSQIQTAGGAGPEGQTASQYIVFVPNYPGGGGVTPSIPSGSTNLRYTPSTGEFRAGFSNNNSAGTKTTTADANVTIDAALTQSVTWIASLTTTRSLIINNLADGRQVNVYIRNTNATQRQIIFSGSATTTGHVLMNMSVGAGIASTNTQNIVGTSGTMLVHAFNIGGNLVGGIS
jgi:hypothetical protein